MAGGNVRVYVTGQVIHGTSGGKGAQTSGRGHSKGGDPMPRVTGGRGLGSEHGRDHWVCVLTLSGATPARMVSSVHPVHRPRVSRGHGPWRRRQCPGVRLQPLVLPREPRPVSSGSWGSCHCAPCGVCRPHIPWAPFWALPLLRSGPGARQAEEAEAGSRAPPSRVCPRVNPLPFHPLWRTPVLPRPARSSGSSGRMP